MKNIFMAVLTVAVVTLMTVSAEAATKLLPKGAKVSATVSSDRTADITVSGVPDLEKIEYYAYDSVKDMEGPKASIDLREGRRFQVFFGGYYVLLTPEMAAVPHPEFFGPGVGLDCSNPGGCCFIVTGD